MASSVYWIHHPEHTDMFTQGYIGVTNRFKRRMYEHNKVNKCLHLKHAIEKYGWENLVKKELLIAEEEYCLDIEKKLRPKDNMGWNIVMGGGKAPKMFGNTWNIGRPNWKKGIKTPQETKEKISQTLLGHEPWNKGLIGSQAAWNKNVPMAYRDTAHFTQEHICPHCQVIGKGNAMLRHHMDKCKDKEII